VETLACASCGHGNRPDRRFCTECGARLGRSCPACGTAVDGGEKFCGSCGAPLGSPATTPAPPRHLAEKILGSRAALEGERKQVTVLFADVKGSMELAEQVDPEEWHRVLDRFSRILAEGVHRFEGSVNQYTGDGIMALFGAPIAHEDHARRACLAALHLGDELRRYARTLRLERGLNFSVRMGLNSGEVVVGTIGDDLRMHYTAQGTTVGLAQRMEQLAEPGTVYVTEHTARLVSGFFRLEELGPFRVKGVREPVRVYELGGVGPLRTPLERARARGFSRFVGREDEMATLEGATARGGEVVAVLADAGTGKSRLCHELAERTRARGIAVHAAHCVAHGKMLPFLPIRMLLHAYFGIADGDADDEARRKIAGTVVLVTPELTDDLPLLFDFVGVADGASPRMDPDARHRRLSALFTQLVARRQDPTVVLVEDLHWIDDGSERFVEALVDALPGTSTLLVVNARPEYRPAWMARRHSRTLALRPLGAEPIAALLADLLGHDPSLAGLAERIRERTAGNPFFIEEVVQALVEGGSLVGAKGAYRLVRPVDELVVPPTVQVLLAARIDRLPDREKEVLQTAAVIGREFAEPVLRRVCQLSEAEVRETVASLEAADFVHDDPVRNELSFKHPLTHEVAYRSQLGERRVRVHAAVARALIDLAPDRLDEHVALVAHHWEEAGDRVEAARWRRRAAQWAGVRDIADAARQGRKVRDLLVGAPETAETLEIATWARFWLLTFAWRLGTSTDEAAALFVEGMDLARRTGDERAAARLLSNYAMVRGMFGGVNDGIELARESARVAERTGDLELQMLTRVALVETQWMGGRFRDVLLTIDEGLERGGARRRVAGGVGFDPHLWLQMMRGGALFHLGRVDDGRLDLERARAIAREQHDDEVLGWAHEMSVYPAEFRGDASEALEHARRAVEIAERLGSPLSLASAYYALGCAQLVGRDPAPAATALEHARAIVREKGIALHWEAVILAVLAEARLDLGEHDVARTAVEEAIRLARARETKAIECRALRARARVLLETEGVASAAAIVETVDAALGFVRETGVAVHEPFLRLVLARLADMKGDPDGRQREVGAAADGFTAMGATQRADDVRRAVRER